MSNLLELAKRCEKATGPDRELDRLIEETRPNVRRHPYDDMVKVGYVLLGPQAYLASDYTASIDVAMALLPSTACNHDLFSFGGGGRTDLPKGGLCWGFTFHDTAHLVGIKRAKADVARLRKDARLGFKISGEPKIMMERAIAENFMEFSSTHAATAALAICAAALRSRSNGG